MTELRKMYVYDADTGRNVSVDALTDSITVIDYDHHEIHGGSTYRAEVQTTSGTAVNIAFKTPAGTKRAHMTMSYTSESKSHLSVDEGHAWTTNTGTVYAPVNMRRDSSNTSMLLEDKSATPDFTAGGVLTNVTANSAGTVIKTLYSFTDKYPGDSGPSRDEMILDVDQTYLITLTSDDGSKGLQIVLEWYEHTDAS
jgi:hypothetical protein